MKFFKLIILSLFFFTMSCKKSEIVPLKSSKKIIDNNSIESSSTSDIQNLYYNIIENENTYDQLLIASALTPDEMYQMWGAKIDDYKANNQLNVNQMIFLENIENELSPAVFVENSSEREAFDFDKKMTEAQNIFGVNEGWYLLSKVENINHRISRLSLSLDEPSDEPIRSCECSKNNDCIRLTGISVWGISWEYGVCNSGNCYVQTYLFGLFVSTNKGRCKY